jgi:hypothetical protein
MAAIPQNSQSPNSFASPASMPRFSWPVGEIEADFQRLVETLFKHGQVSADAERLQNLTF